MTEALEKPTVLELASGDVPRGLKHWEIFQQLSCELCVEISIPKFTVSTLLRLCPSDVIDTHWPQGSDVPLLVNGRLIGWSEFEVIDDHLAARLTQIA